MTTIQLILLIVIVFCAGIEVGILISNFNRNRFLSKHGISPQKLDNVIEQDQLPLNFSSDINISIKETKASN